MIESRLKKIILDSSVSSTAFQTLYSGYSYFSCEFANETAVIAYVSTGLCWVGAAEPVVSRANFAEFMNAFRDEAKREGKSAACLPVGAEAAIQFRAAGFYALQIGSEPWYRISQIKENQNARALARKGARVECFQLDCLLPEEKIDLDELLQRWKASRKMADLGFLNRVEPWSLFREKRYFRIMHQEKVLAFLAAVPVRARNAWYLVDLIRDPRAPAGTTELTLVKSSEYLQNEGSEWVTLGMSPFSPPSEKEKLQAPMLYAWLNRIFNRAERLYGFKSLFEYKQKFNPNHWEAQYLVFLAPRISIRSLIGMASAVFPGGFARAFWQTARRFLQRASFNALYQKTLNFRIVPKRPPESTLAFLYATKVSLTLAALNLLFFFATTDEHFRIRKAVLSRYPYSLEHLILGESPTRGAIDIVIASFLHWDAWHLIGNLMLLISLMAFLECVAGSLFVASIYCLGILVSNPLTSLLLSPYYFISRDGFFRFFSEPDVGCSLGIFACIGALSFLVKRPGILIYLMTLATLIYNIHQHSVLGYNHLVALAIGYFMAKKYVEN